jgi:hypothetical protein
VIEESPAILRGKDVKNVENSWDRYCRIPIIGVNSMSDEGFVQEFLEELVELLDEGRVNFAPRSEKTRQFMLDYDLIVDDLFDALRQLHVGHCYKGPEKDRNGGPGDLLFFKYFFIGIEVYIKISIVRKGDDSVGALISFHPEGLHDE